MNQRIAHIALVVSDYDEAIEFYTQTLGFTLLDDTPQSATKRWVLVRPPGADECSLLLARGVGEEQRSRIGNQTGGLVFLFVATDDFQRDYDKYAFRCVGVFKRATRNRARSPCVMARMGLRPKECRNIRTQAFRWLTSRSPSTLRSSMYLAG